MQRRKLGRTDIDVSILCLGTMTWGEQNTQQQAFEQLDAALDAGVNFIDCAEMYPVPPKNETYGSTETILGNWLQQRNNRHDIVLASKVCGRADWLPYVRDGEPRLNAKNITSAIHESLKRLQTDYLDLYQLHWPDRNTNYFGHLGYSHQENEDYVSFLETLECLAELVQQGLVRHIGLSNETPWGSMQFLNLSEQRKLPRMVSIQNPYNLLNRTFEIGLAEISHREQLGLLAYSPLGFGVLSGKYLHGAQPQGARITLFERFTRYTNEVVEKATLAYVTLAHNSGLNPAQMALAYVNSRPFLTSNIIGATTMEQLDSNLKSIELTLPQDVIDEIENIHQQFSNPAP